jgi:hypothetical protein
LLLCHYLCHYKPVQTLATPCNEAPAELPGVQQHTRRAATYQKVLDGRKRPIRGLWKRNDRYYARIAVAEESSGIKKVLRVPLKAETVAQAQAELRRLITKREDNALPILKQTPKFSRYVAEYLAFYEQVKDAKRPRTLETEKGHLNQWIEHCPPPERTSWHSPWAINCQYSN